MGFHIDADELRLIQFSVKEDPVWLTEREKLRVKASGTDFMDITDHPFLGSKPKRRFSYPAPNSSFVATVFPYLTTSEPKAILTHLTSYHTRHYSTETGASASDWLHAKILAYTDELASDTQKPLISVESVKHSWPQSSIVIRIAPLDAHESDPTAVIGAHIDSINHENVLFRAPGAGDDGSGTVTILEAYRGALLVECTVKALAARFEETGKHVRGMLQLDMTAFLKAGTREEIAVITNENQVDAELTDFLVQVLKKHIDLPWVYDVYPSDSRGRGPASDHMSWKRAGFQSAHVLESQFNNTNPHIHGVEDLLDITPEFSFDHMLHFMKLAVAFAVELSSY
ncbi:Peptide hydrolase [Mycena kentingensis (nom. inval.)]|nr:Peptide hydrolase [Mycena kentingensis (nom. inval.)]